jgi:hypothetical protein
MKKILTILFLVLSISCHKKEHKGNDSLSIDTLLTSILPSLAEVPGDNYGIGWGYNSASLEVLGGQVVKYKTGDLIPSINVGGQYSTFDLKLVSTQSSLKKSLDISVNASVTYGVFSGSANYDYYHSTSVSDYSDYLVAKVIVRNPAEYLQNPELTDEALWLASNNLPNFIERYGDQYIYGRVTGGAIYVIFKFTSKSSSEQNATRTSVNAAVKSFTNRGKTSASLGESLQSLNVTSELEVKVIRDGDNTPFSTRMDILINQLINFPEVVKGRGKPIIVELLTKPILGIKNFPANIKRSDFAVIDRQQEFFGAAAAKMDLLNQNIGNCEYVVQNEIEFEKSSVDDAKSKFDELSQLKNRLQNCVNKVRREFVFTEDCSNVGNLVIKPLTFNRRDGVVQPIPPQEQPTEFAITPQYSKIKTLETGRGGYLNFQGKLSLPGTPGTCKSFNYFTQRELDDIPSTGAGSIQKFLIQVKQVSTNNPEQIWQEMFYSGQDVEIRKVGVDILVRSVWVIVSKTREGKLLFQFVELGLQPKPEVCGGKLQWVFTD